MHAYIEPRIVLLMGLLSVLAVPNPAAAQDKAGLWQRARTLRTFSVADHPAQSVLDVHNMTTWLRNDAFLGWVDPFSGVNGTFPKRTAGAVFAQGVVWGGKVFDGRDHLVRVNGSTYTSGLDPGKILRDAAGNVVGPDEIDPVKYHVWRVRRDWEMLDYTEAASYFFGVAPGAVTDEMRAQVREQYEYDWNNWPAAWGAPYEDVDGDGVYHPSVDVPGEPGADQTMWIVTNDLRPSTSERSYGSSPIGIEYQLTIWGHAAPASSALGNVHFARSRLIYAGRADTPSDAHIDSLYVVQWTDPDVGNAGDDYAGSDTTLSLMYAYNAGAYDARYDPFDLAPPAVGWSLLQGSVRGSGESPGAAAIAYFAAGLDITDPDMGAYTGTLQWYNLMRGLRPRPAYPSGEPFVDQVTGAPTRFLLTGDPVTGSGWIDGTTVPPGDRRIVLSSGPHQMHVGDTLDVVISQIGAEGPGHLASVDMLKDFARLVQRDDDCVTTTKDIALQAGWNLVGMCLRPEDPAPSDVFAPLVEAGRLDYATGFDGGATFYDPAGPPFLNTLREMEPCRGYWLKVREATTLTVSGTPACCEHDLSRGWGLMGYCGASRPAEEAFAAIVDAAVLEYVTGFEGRAVFFDPDGPPFLNTLQTVEPWSGYWVKVTEEAPGFRFPGQDDVCAACGETAPFAISPPALDARRSVPARGSGSVSDVTPTNRFMFVSGRLAGAPLPEGTVVEVVTEAGRIVGATYVARRYNLMTAPVYGDDLTTEAVDGARDGGRLLLRVGGTEYDVGLRFAADMERHAVELAVATSVEDVEAVPERFVLEQNYPNPFNPETTIRYGVPEASHVRVVVYDALGRQVRVLVDGTVEAGWHEAAFDAADLPSGVYLYRVEAGTHVGTRRMLLVK